MTANLPTRGGDARQGRGGAKERKHLSFSCRNGAVGFRLAGQRPPLACRPSPPQGGRSAASAYDALLDGSLKPGERELS
jgi:hypothetical protein